MKVWPTRLHERRSAAENAVARARLIMIALLVMLALVGVVVPQLDDAVVPTLPTAGMFVLQDMRILPLFLLVLLLLRPQDGVVAWRGPRWWPLLLAVLLVLVCWWGHYGVLSATDLSRDEQMANYDATIFAHGRLFAPTPLAWRHFAPALNDKFFLPVGGGAGWISGYLPGNAMLRAIVGLVADPALTSPLLVGAGLLALYRIALRLWPESPGARATALVCYAGSSQVVIAGMTAYAMSAHLALDLVWLALFLRGDRRGQIGALAIGFVATGLHQPVFHPLFALPFIVTEWRRDRARCVGYAIGYAAIAAFWLAWPHLVSHAASSAPLPPAAELGFADRARSAATALGANSLWLMAINLLRFVVWQHPLMLPLAVLAAGAARREPLVAALIAGPALTVLAVAIVMPMQGHGWGYRYLHGEIGNACLLAGYGWRGVERLGVSLGRAMLIATIADVLLLLPAHAWMAHRMTAPNALLDARLRQTHADLVIVDDAPFAYDVVLNRPDLSNRPLRLDGSYVVPADLATLCARGTVAFVDGDTMIAHAWSVGVARYPGTSPHQRQLRAAAVSAKCRIVASDTPR